MMMKAVVLRAGAALRSTAARSSTASRQVGGAGVPKRSYGSGAGETFEGVTIHEPEAWQLRLANGVSALMWYVAVMMMRYVRAWECAGCQVCVYVREAET